MNIPGDDPRYSQEKIVQEVHIKQSKSQEAKSPPHKKKRITRRRPSLEIPEPTLKTNYFTIGKSPKNAGISNVVTGRPKRTSQQGIPLNFTTRNGIDFVTVIR